MFRISVRTGGYFLAGLFAVALVNSSLDIYNTFAYDKAILRDSPYGYAPLLKDPMNYGSADGLILSGEFVYVTDWLSAYNGRIVFAKVKSKLKEGYINKELLTEANINIKPVISVVMLLLMTLYFSRKLYHTLKIV